MHHQRDGSGEWRNRYSVNATESSIGGKRRAKFVGVQLDGLALVIACISWAGRRVVQLKDALQLVQCRLLCSLRLDSASAHTMSSPINFPDLAESLILKVKRQMPYSRTQYQDKNCAHHLGVDLLRCAEDVCAVPHQAPHPPSEFLPEKGKHSLTD